MHKLMELKEMLCEELEEYGSKGKLDMGGLEIVDKLAHAIKNIDKIIESYEDGEYSMRGGSYGTSYQGEGGSYRGSSRMGGSYRGSSRRGSSYRNSMAQRRDSRGRYSSTGYSMGNEDMVEELRELMQEAPNEQVRQEFQSLIQNIEQM